MLKKLESTRSNPLKAVLLREIARIPATAASTAAFKEAFAKLPPDTHLPSRGFNALAALTEESVPRWHDPSRRTSRANDAERHYGGAGIAPYYDPTGANLCTSGFVVSRGGILGAVTAAHCFLLDGLPVYSGVRYYGITAGMAPYPQWDMVRIDPDGQRYINIIHTGPVAPVIRIQIASSDARIGDSVCISGVRTGAKCSLRVTADSGHVCEGDLCTYGLMYAARAGTIVNQGGDSGAPIYVREGDTAATIKGMNVGGDTTCDNSYFHNVGVIEATLGVTVAK